MKNKFTKEQVIDILEQFGYKSYNSGKETYLLQVRQKFRPTTKLSIDKVMKIFNGKEEEPAVKKEPAKLKGGKKKDE